MVIDNLPPDWGNGWNNVWIGVSVESQDYINRIDTLSKIPAKIRFVSFEPLLGSIGSSLTGGIWSNIWITLGYL